MFALGQKQTFEGDHSTTGEGKAPLPSYTGSTNRSNGAIAAVTRRRGAPLAHLVLLIALSATYRPHTCAAILQCCEVTLAASMCALWAADVTSAILRGIGRVRRANDDDAHPQNCNKSDPTEHDILRFVSEYSGNHALLDSSARRVVSWSNKS